MLLDGAQGKLKDEELALGRMGQGGQMPCKGPVVRKV